MAASAKATKVRCRFTGAAGAPADLASREIVYSGPDNTLYIGSGDDGSGNPTSVVAIGGAGAFLARGLLNAANGVAGLGSDGRLPTSLIPAGIVGAMQYQGTWNASANSPALASGSGTKGYFYKVGTAGATTLDGIGQWNVGDMVLFDGTTWDKIDGIASEVLSVAGRTGVVALTSADLTDATATGRALVSVASVAAARQALAIDGYRGINDAAAAIGPGDVHVSYTALAQARTVTLPAANGVNPGREFVIEDGAGVCTATKTITVAAAGTDTINGAATAVLASAYAAVRVRSDGVSAWLIVAQVPAGSGTATGVDPGTY